MHQPATQAVIVRTEKQNGFCFEGRDNLLFPCTELNYLLVGEKHQQGRKCLI